MPHRSAGDTRREPLLGSLVLLLLLAAFCAATESGRSWVALSVKTWNAWVTGRRLSLADRRLAVYDKTYPMLLWLRDAAPQDAVLLLPPRQFLIEQLDGKDQIPLLASPSSAYSFLYPRVPVHFGDASPWKERLTHVLVWDPWGLDLIAPEERPAGDARIKLCHWPAGRPAPW